VIGPADIPALPRGVRLAPDRVRGGTVLLGPERVLALDPVGVAVLTRVDGRASVAAICDDLAGTFAAPREVIEPDVLSFLGELADKRLVDLSHG
jgi:coenzyme PQQ biosynthesis protein PqqD